MLKEYAVKALDYFSRKFVLSAASLGTGFWLVLNDKDVMEYSMLVGVVLGFYNGANVVETVANIRSNRLQTKSTPAPEGTTVEVNVEG